MRATCGSDPGAGPRFRARRAGPDVAISQVTAAEIELGLRHLPASKRRRALEAQWSAIGPELVRLPWSDEVSRRFGERRARLDAQSKADTAGKRPDAAAI